MPNARFSMLDRGKDEGRPAQASGDDLRKVRFRGAGFLPQTSRYAGLVAIVAVIGLWQLASNLTLVNPVFLPTPLSVQHAQEQQAKTGTQRQHLAYSVLRIGTGWILR